MPIEPVVSNEPLSRLTKITLLDRLGTALEGAIRQPVGDLAIIDTALGAYVSHLKREGGRPEHLIVHVRDTARRAAEHEKATRHPEWMDSEMFVMHVERRVFRAYFRAD
jgi:hypothetical protein